MTKRRPARVYCGTTRNLDFLARKLQAGELVAVPTETVYGLAANAFSAQACAKIFRAKRRPFNDPLIVHIHSPAELPRICLVNDAARRLARRFWPGPLTLVLPKTSAVPDLVTAGQPSVAVRIPRHALFRRLLARTGLPLAAPSANPFGYISPTSAEHVRTSLKDRIQYILDGGEAKIGLESTIVDLRDPLRPVLLRPGAITVPQLESALGCRVRYPGPQSQENAAIAPGSLPRHYSPHTPVKVHARLKAAAPMSEALVFMRKPPGLTASNVFWLDTHGSLAGAARRLFSILRKIDVLGFKSIHVELARGGGIASAINDRLSRAACR